MALPDAFSGSPLNIPPEEKDTLMSGDVITFSVEMLRAVIAGAMDMPTTLPIRFVKAQRWPGCREWTLSVERVGP